ncbi:hypothetical protein FBULB1_1843 [Fusarium bulbicola]|nr:hypothetical protein FBULB1_1843 [Fusarium bulbicola]
MFLRRFISLFAEAWLFSEYGPRPNPYFERSSDAHKAQMTLDSINEAADDERNLVASFDATSSQEPNHSETKAEKTNRRLREGWASTWRFHESQRTDFRSNLAQFVCGDVALVHLYILDYLSVTSRLLCSVSNVVDEEIRIGLWYSRREELTSLVAMDSGTGIFTGPATFAASTGFASFHDLTNLAASAGWASICVILLGQVHRHRHSYCQKSAYRSHDEGLRGALQANGGRKADILKTRKEERAYGPKESRSACAHLEAHATEFLPTVANIVRYSATIHAIEAYGPGPKAGGVDLGPVSVVDGLYLGDVLQLDAEHTVLTVHDHFLTHESPLKGIEIGTITFPSELLPLNG